MNTPPATAGGFFLSSNLRYFVVAHLVGYLRAPRACQQYSFLVRA